MLDNLLILAISILLALATLRLPVPKIHWGGGFGVFALIALFLFTALGTLWFFAAKSTLAILVLSLVLSGLAKLIAINFKIVQSARYPKNRRCY